MSTPHNSGEKGDFAKTVLMAGDPLRAKFIAENYLEDYKLISTVRNMYAFTGYYKGKRVSVMGSGMGIPSIGIYATELFTYYDVDTIIRIGSAGSYQEDVKVYDVVVAQGACTNSSFAQQYIPVGGQLAAISNFDLCKKAYEYATSKGIRAHVGNVLSSDIFYHVDPNYWKQWQQLGVLAVEMESYALFTLAAYYHKKALTILTISDSFIDSTVTTPLERERNFKQMFEIALEIAE